MCLADHTNIILCRFLTDNPCSSHVLPKTVLYTPIVPPCLRRINRYSCNMSRKCNHVQTKYLWFQPPLLIILPELAILRTVWIALIRTDDKSTILLKKCLYISFTSVEKNFHEFYPRVHPFGVSLKRRQKHGDIAEGGGGSKCLILNYSFVTICFNQIVI